MKKMSSQEFLLSRRAKATRVSYKWSLEYCVKDADQFLKLARNDKKKAERQLIDWIIKERERVAPSTVRAPISALQSFCDYNEVILNWRKIKSVLPKAKKVANDEAPTHEQIRQLLTVCSPRERAVVLIMTSSGIRVGAFDGMKVGHLKINDDIGELKVYPGDAEEYFTFITPEAMKAVNNYLDSRRAVGEELTDDSPLIRDRWAFENRHTTIDPSVAKPVSPKALANMFGNLWVKSGVRNFKFKENGYERHEFQNVHGFRKFFETHAVMGMYPVYAEILKGDKKHYIKTPKNILLNEYRKAIPHLTINNPPRDMKKKEREILKELVLQMVEQSPDIMKMLMKINREAEITVEMVKD